MLVRTSMCGWSATERLERLLVRRRDGFGPESHGHHDFAVVIRSAHEHGRHEQQSRDEDERGGDEGGEARAAHLSPDTRIEDTMWRWKATNSATNGTIATVVAAITKVH